MGLVAERDLLQFLAVILPLSDCKFVSLVNELYVFLYLFSVVIVCYENGACITWQLGDFNES